MQRRLGPVVIALTLLAAAAGSPASAQQQIFIEAGQSVGDPTMMPGPAAGTAKRVPAVFRTRAVDRHRRLRRAQVRLTAPEIRSTALTDAEGRFEFRELPAGRFTLNASKSGYVSVQYGQTRPFEQGRPIELADRQVLDKTDVAMPRGGVISGRIVDEFGDPLPDALVSAMRQTWSNGRRRLLPTGRTSQTNDLGQFRMSAAASEYTSASPEHRHHDHGCGVARRPIVGSVGSTPPDTRRPISGDGDRANGSR